MLHPAIAALDRQLTTKGQSVVLRRYTGPASAPLSTWSDTPVRAKSIPANAAELVAGINMTGRRLILSPTDAGDAAPALNRDAIMDGSTKRVIESWVPVKLGDQVVRIEAQVRGG